MFKILFCFAVLMTNALSCDKELDSISPTHCTGFSKDSKILNFYISSGDRFDICSNKMGYNLVLMNYSIFDANYARKYFAKDLLCRSLPPIYHTHSKIPKYKKHMSEIIQRTNKHCKVFENIKLNNTRIDN